MFNWIKKLFKKTPVDVRPLDLTPIMVSNKVTPEMEEKFREYFSKNHYYKERNKYEPKSNP